MVHVSPSLGCRLSELFSRAGYENAERDQTQTAPAPLWLRLLPDILNDGARATRAQLSSYRGEQMPQVMFAQLAMRCLAATRRIRTSNS